MEQVIARKYQSWCECPSMDEQNKKALLEMADDEQAIIEAFYQDLAFGTAGLRGILGPGTNRMNIYTVGKATQGLSNYIVKQGQEAMKKGVVIAYDSRIMSKEFAEHSASILAANGIHVYLFDALRPTPELSFAIRYLKTISGIVITASHNPAQYNGYKEYLVEDTKIYTNLDTNDLNNIPKQIMKDGMVLDLITTNCVDKLQRLEMIKEFYNYATRNINLGNDYRILIKSRNMENNNF